MRDMVELDVEYPTIPNDIQVSDECIESAVREFRKNLEYAVSLEKELGGHGLSLLAPIESDADLRATSFGREHGISGALFFYVDLFKKLVEKNASAAKLEYLAWPIDDDSVFAVLRIWASGDQRLFSADEGGDILCLLSDYAFWYSRYQRDLLLALAKRWSDFSGRVKTKLGSRLLNGPPKLVAEEVDEYKERRAWWTLNRIEWLRSRGCEFDFDVNGESRKLRVIVPKWQPEYARKAADSLESRGGWVQTDTEPEALLKVPLSKVLDKAKELSGRNHELLVDRDPFAGLASNRPMRALSALTISAKHKDYPTWAWRTFLNSEARKSDKPKLSAFIAERVSGFPSEILAENIYSVCAWLFTSSTVLLKSFPQHFERLWIKLIAVLKSDTETANSSIIRGKKDPDWPLEALNAPVGKLAQVLMNDPQKDENQTGQGFSSRWIGRVDELLSFQGDLRRHALVMFAFNLNWFYQRDTGWTEKNLLSALDKEGQDQNALMAGFFWAAQVPNHELFLRLKPQLLTLAKNSAIRGHEYAAVLADLLLAGWRTTDRISGDRYVTNAEMRDVLVSSDDEFRSSILWRLEKSSEAEDEKKNWAKQISIFLNEVWPRQKSVKTPMMTAKLCNLAFSASAFFSNVVDAILPLVTKMNETSRHELLRLEGDTVSQNAEKALALLSAILPENATVWPYGIESALEAIELTEPVLSNDPRFVELKRRWNSR